VKEKEKTLVMVTEDLDDVGYAIVLEKTIVLVGCSKQKSTVRCTAREMYWPSQLFRKSYTYATKLSQTIFILSALHGLLKPDQIIEPYNEVLMHSKMKYWAERVHGSLTRDIRYKVAEKVVILAGKKYYHHLAKMVEGDGKNVELPLKGMGIGERLSWLTRKINRRAAAESVCAKCGKEIDQLEECVIGNKHYHLNCTPDRGQKTLMEFMGGRK